MPRARPASTSGRLGPDAPRDGPRARRLLRPSGRGRGDGRLGTAGGTGRAGGQAPARVRVPACLGPGSRSSRTPRRPDRAPARTRRAFRLPFHPPPPRADRRRPPSHDCYSGCHRAAPPCPDRSDDATFGRRRTGEGLGRAAVTPGGTSNGAGRSSMSRSFIRCHRGRRGHTDATRPDSPGRHAGLRRRAAPGIPAVRGGMPPDRRGRARRPAPL